MSREHARQQWQRIAAGDLEFEQDGPVDLRAWVRQVAIDLLEADATPDAVRPGTVLAATGLAGRRDPNAELREMVELLDEFPVVDSSSTSVRATRQGERMKTLISMADSRSLRRQDESDIELRKRIERLGSTRKV